MKIEDEIICDRKRPSFIMFDANTSLLLSRSTYEREKLCYMSKTHFIRTPCYLPEVVFHDEPQLILTTLRRH